MPRTAKKAPKRRYSMSSSPDTGISTTKNGLTVEVKMRSIQDVADSVEAVALSVDTDMKGPLLDVVKGMVGKRMFENCYKSALDGRGSRKLMPGEILPIALDASESPSSVTHTIRYVILVVRPELPSLKMAYRSVIKFAMDNQCTTVAFPGLGCGGLGVCPKRSAAKLNEVIDEWSGGFNGYPQTVTVIDRDFNVVSQFRHILGITNPRSGDASSASSAHGGALAVAADASPEEFVLSVTIAPDQLDASDCSVCMDGLSNGEYVVALITCGHQIHYECFLSMQRASPRRNCWMCQRYFALPLGNMPNGTMTHQIIREQVPGYPDAQGCICIQYNIHGGVQSATHLRPGVRFHGTSRVAYLPNNEQGQKVLRLLQRAFECKLTFTVGDSVTTGAQNVVVWNNVHHKTNLHGGATGFGYPDPEYLNRVTEELAAQGIVEE